MAETLIPDFMDEVKHRTAGISGTVIAVYQEGLIRKLDVRVDDRIYYGTFASNWEVTVKYEP